MSKVPGRMYISYDLCMHKWLHAYVYLCIYEYRYMFGFMCNAPMGTCVYWNIVFLVEDLTSLTLNFQI